MHTVETTESKDTKIGKNSWDVRDRSFSNSLLRGEIGVKVL